MEPEFTTCSAYCDSLPPSVCGGVVMFMGFLSRPADGSVRPHRAVAVFAFVATSMLLQACSSSREQGDGGSWKLWGDDSPKTASKSPSGASNPQWRQPSAFDNDGPPANGAGPTYRGGRDPMTGRASDWPPAAPPPVETTNLPPVPQYSQPAPAYNPPPYASSAAPPPRAAPFQPAAGYAPPSPALARQTPGSIDVQQGDTLYRIARANNITVPALMQANGLTNESIRPGQRLMIPGG